jgi:hypothetical protein
MKVDSRNEIVLDAYSVKEHRPMSNLQFQTANYQVR